MQIKAAVGTERKLFWSALADRRARPLCALNLNRAGVDAKIRFGKTETVSVSKSETVSHSRS